MGAIVSLLIAGYLAFQHFSRAGSLQRAFDQGSVVATLAIICITAVTCLLFIWIYCGIIVKDYINHLYIIVTRIKSNGSKMMS